MTQPNPSLPLPMTGFMADAIDEAPDTPRSKLDAYAGVIWELRRKRKRLHFIAAFLNARGLTVSRATVGRWLQRHPPPQKTSPAATASPQPEAGRTVVPAMPPANAYEYNNEDDRNTPQPANLPPIKRPVLDF